MFSRVQLLFNKHQQSCINKAKHRVLSLSALLVIAILSGQANAVISVSTSKTIQGSSPRLNTTL